MMRPLLPTCLSFAMMLMPALVHADPHGSYLLGCGGCHGEQGVSNSKLVPDLRDQVGYFLAAADGRGYLARLPNVAFYAGSDADVAEILNYMLFTLAGASTPKNTKPYTAAEVGELRKHPLTEVSLIAYRNKMIDSLLAQHRAPESLRSYSAVK
jgi:hypothetical protein